MIKPIEKKVTVNSLIVTLRACSHVINLVLGEFNIVIQCFSFLLFNGQILKHFWLVGVLKAQMIYTAFLTTDCLNWWF